MINGNNKDCDNCENTPHECKAWEIAKKEFKRHAWVWWIGGSLGLANIYFYQWEFYAVLVPTVLLAQWSKYEAD